ncbi:hypothetical protein Tco_0455629 [Tanacetum coccineum]
MIVAANGKCTEPGRCKHPDDGFEETPSIGVKNKVAYVGHRRFLKKPHKWRSSREFPMAILINRDTPRENPRGCMVFADKSWLEKPRGSREFYDGVQKFVAHCTPLVNSAGKIRCPCKRCRNILFKPIEWIGDHISDDEDPLPHDLADSDVEDLINDDDGVEKVYSSEEED